jgi:AcrR family transcriptional regulator
MSGRVNQKRRTRQAVVDAARAIVERGQRPTVAAAAEEALVSRTTAYRYFPTQESLLFELSIEASVEEIEELLAKPSEGTQPDTRLLEIVDQFNRNTLANEVLARSALRHLMDTWLATEHAGEDHHSPLREGRRRRWISTVLEPFRDRIAPRDLQRLESALCLVMGAEAITVLRDICHLDSDQAVAVAHWAAETMLTAALHPTVAGALL